MKGVPTVTLQAKKRTPAMSGSGKGASEMMTGEVGVFKFFLNFNVIGLI